MKLPIHHWSALAGRARQALLARPVLRDGDALREDVQRILAQVRRDGDAGLRALTQKYDGVGIDTLRVEQDEFAAAEKSLSWAALSAIQLAIDNVHRFHAARPAGDYAVDTQPGVSCRRISHPIDAVGLYVPAGSAPLPSAAVMLAVPAAIAGCPRRILCTPPRADGRADAAVLVAAHRGGVSEVYKVGGAQAIGAMAYGTESVPQVNKIFGPGNAWVTAAKTIVAADSGAAAIDLPAGPSEVLVMADAQADPAFVAADLLAQAEHGSDSQVVLVATDLQLAERVAMEVARQLPLLSRRSLAASALESCRLIVADDLAQAIEISNAYAPEHLIVQIREPRRALGGIRNAGSIFLGAWSPESAGDYCSGTNHVLPTHGHARAWSGLSVDQFMRHMTVQELTRAGLESIAPAILELAALEGLDGHAAAVDRRLRAPVVAGAPS